MGLILEALSTVFDSLGRAFICLDRSFRVVHSSQGFHALVGEGTARTLPGRPIEEVLGPELFGPNGALRRALEAGERREGWGATLRQDDEGPRLVSVTTAPIEHDPSSSVCDPRVAYLVVLRPAQDKEETGARSPTVFSGLVARSQAMRRIFLLIEKLEQSDATVLISGESGTGKELVARAIHLHSPQRKGPFVAVNCGALPGDLLESELFGHVRGAFTGATRDRIGRFELATGGTLFLDEAGDLPLHLQVKLLRVLQERTFERVGESRSRRTDARIIAATNRDLRQAVLDGRFREDLFYRLRVLPIDIPPLRERREDVEPLARYLLTRVGAHQGRSLRLSPEALRLLLRHDWPGNARELENALEYAVAVCEAQTIHPQDLPPEVVDPSTAAAAGSHPPANLRTRSTAAEAAEKPMRTGGEKERLLAALEANHWRRDQAAKQLGISRTTLWRKMRELGLIG
ncbi:MAG: AAA domain-containing protein [bacterium]|nr:AAA domain-containing protein [bacterium]